MPFFFTARSWFRRLGPAACLCAFASVAFGQTPTLGELAKQEQARRNAIKAAGRVVTNKDLPKASQPPAQPSPAQQPAAAVSPEATKAAPPKDEPEKDEKWWRERMNQAREALRRDELFAEALQSRINALTTEFVNRDDPYQRARIGEDRQKALAELDRVRADIQSATKRIADIEEEARQAGVPPGWLR